MDDDVDTAQIFAHLTVQRGLIRVLFASSLAGMPKAAATKFITQLRVVPKVASTPSNADRRFAEKYGVEIMHFAAEFRDEFLTEIELEADRLRAEWQAVGGPSG